MSEHLLLTGHAQRWAQAKHRDLDPELLQTLLTLRADHDELAPTYWPEASVEHLLLVRWPAHGPQSPPDPHDLMTTLDTFWRFLRSTGRLGFGSAQPAELSKAARRAVPRMAEACADPARHGPAKVLVDFGRTMGIDLDGAESAEQLQDRFDAILTAWNDLPDDERQRLMPALSPPAGAGPDPVKPDEPAAGASAGIPRGDRAAAAEQARAAAFTRSCVELARWVGDGQPVTPNGVLRISAAKQAYAALELSDWLSRWHARRAADRSTYASAGSATPQQQEPPKPGAWPWRSAAECEPLDRLWWSAVSARFIEVGKTKAQATDRPRPDEDWLAVGTGLVFGLCQRWHAARGWAFLGVLYLCALSTQGWAPIDMVRAWWAEQTDDGPPPPDRSAQSPDEAKRFARFREEVKQSRLDELLADFDDTGLWQRRGDEIRLTDFGLEFAAVFGAALQDGWLPENAPSPTP